MNDLFGNEEKESSTSNPATITSALMKFGGLFSDNKDHMVLFGKRKLQKKRPASAVLLFGGRGKNSFNLVAEAAVKRKRNENKDRIINITLVIATSSLDNLFKSFTKVDKSNDLFSFEPEHPPSMVAKKPTRLPLEDDDKEEPPVKHSVSKL